MSCEKKELHIDRIEDGIVVAYDSNGYEYTMCARIADVKENDIVDATVNERDQIIDLRVLPEKTKAAKLSLQERLSKLFNN